MSKKKKNSNAPETNDEQLVNAIKKHNLKVDSTKKTEDQQDQPVSDKKDQKIIKALKNI